MQALALVGREWDPLPSAYRSSWREAGRVEATEAWASEESYALSPRSTRGATRA